MLRDLRLAFRQLVHRPGFNLALILTLAVGLGANAAIFSLVDAVLLRPLPYPEPATLVAMHETVERDGIERRAFSYLDVQAVRQGAPAVLEMAAVGGATRVLGGSDLARRLLGERVEPSYFSVLSVAPSLGPGLTPAVERSAETAAEVVIAHQLWQSALGGIDDVIGQPLELSGDSFTIVGVMPAGFRGLDEEAVFWLSMLDLPPEALDRPGDRWLETVARLAPGATIEQLRQQLSSIFAELEVSAPDSHRDYSATAVPLRDEFVGTLERPIAVLSGAVGLLLLIACANVANMMLVQTMRRRRQTEIRLALGAKTIDLLRPTLIESLLVGLAAGLIGTLLAAWTVPMLLRLSPIELPAFASVGVDWRVLAFCLLLACGTALVIGVVAAWRQSRSAAMTGLRNRSIDDHRGFARRALLTAQVALALVVSIAAALLMQSWWQLSHVEPGFDADQGVVLYASLPGDSAEQRGVTSRSLLLAASNSPGVRSAALASSAPLAGGYRATVVSPQGAKPRPDETYGGGFRTYRHLVSASYLDTLGIPLLAGRAIEPADELRDGLPVAMVSWRLAERLWPDEDPLGRRFKIGLPLATEPATEPAAEPEAARDADPPTWYTVIGVTGEVRHRNLVADSERIAEDPDLYLALGQHDTRNVALIARLQGSDGAERAEGLRRELQAVDAAMPIYDPTSLGRLVERQTARSRFSSTLISCFALLALLLAALGIYSVVAYQVAERVRDIGVRMALGADPVRVTRDVLWSGMRWVGLGLVVGWLLALGGARWISSVLYRVDPMDVRIYLGAVCMLVVVAAVACLVPAMRASRIDPLVALRED